VTPAVVQAARMRERKKRGPGRPSFGVTESVLTIRIPETLLEAMKAKAEKEGITASEAWRRAAREWLGQGPDSYQKYLEAKEGTE
jgi:hypothetical protein